MANFKTTLEVELNVKKDKALAEIDKTRERLNGIKPLQIGVDKSALARDVKSAMAKIPKDTLQIGVDKGETSKSGAPSIGPNARKGAFEQAVQRISSTSSRPNMELAEALSNFKDFKGISASYEKLTAPLNETKEEANKRYEGQIRQDSKNGKFKRSSASKSADEGYSDLDLSIIEYEKAEAEREKKANEIFERMIQEIEREDKIKREKQSQRAKIAAKVSKGVRARELRNAANDVEKAVDYDSAPKALPAPGKHKYKIEILEPEPEAELKEEAPKAKKEKVIDLDPSDYRVINRDEKKESSVSTDEFTDAANTIENASEIFEKSSEEFKDAPKQVEEASKEIGASTDEFIDAANTIENASEVFEKSAEEIKDGPKKEGAGDSGSGGASRKRGSQSRSGVEGEGGGGGNFKIGSVDGIHINKCAEIHVDKCNVIKVESNGSIRGGGATGGPDSGATGGRTLKSMAQGGKKGQQEEIVPKSLLGKTLSGFKNFGRDMGTVFKQQAEGFVLLRNKNFEFSQSFAEAQKSMKSMKTSGVAMFGALSAAVLASTAAISTFFSIMQKMTEAENYARSMHNLNNEMERLKEKSAILGYSNGDMLKSFVDLKVQEEQLAWENRFLGEDEMNLAETIRLVKNAFLAFFDTLADLVISLTSDVTPSFNDVQSILVNYVAPATATVLTAFEVMKDGIEFCVGALQACVGWLGKKFSGVFTVMGNSIYNFGQFFSNLFKDFGKYVQIFWEDYILLFPQICNNAFRDAFTVLKNFIANVWTLIKNFMSGFDLWIKAIKRFNPTNLKKWIMGEMSFDELLGQEYLDYNRHMSKGLVGLTEGTGEKDENGNAREGYAQLSDIRAENERNRGYKNPNIWEGMVGLTEGREEVEKAYEAILQKGLDKMGQKLDKYGNGWSDVKKIFEDFKQTVTPALVKNFRKREEKDRPIVHIGNWERLQTMLSQFKTASTESLTAAYDRIEGNVANKTNEILLKVLTTLQDIRDNNKRAKEDYVKKRKEWDSATQEERKNMEEPIAPLPKPEPKYNAAVVQELKNVNENLVKQFFQMQAMGFGQNTAVVGG